MTEPQHPLQWPDHQPRTKPSARRESAFKVAPQQAFSELIDEIARFNGVGPIVSTNAPRRRDGRIYSDALDDRLDDPGVAVYFTREKQRVVFACDTYLTVWENIRAIWATLDALRRIERNGAHQLFNQAFTGFAALPAPGAIHWSVTLGISPDATPDQITAAYRTKARELGANGNDAARAELNVARDKALEERSSK